MSDPAGRGLQQAWAGCRQWRLLAAGPDAALSVLQAWSAWKADPQRPALLHLVAVATQAAAAGPFVPAVPADAALAPLARELAQRAWGLVPGVHRLQLEQGRVLLTVCIGEPRAVLADLSNPFDLLVVDARALAPSHTEAQLAKALARLCGRGTLVEVRGVSERLRRELAPSGFVLDPADDEALHGRFDPAWALRRTEAAGVDPSQAVVIGGGLAGASVASSLARRGWQVQVLDAADRPASGASALPAGLLAPHVSPDDNLLSRLTRSGVRLTLQEASQRLRDGVDWSPSGVLRRRAAAERPPADLGAAGEPWQRWADASHTDLRHEAGAWIRPSRLVAAWLDQPGITWRGGSRVARLQVSGAGWQVLGDGDAVLARAPLVVVAGALGSAALLPGLPPLHPVRGQVSWGLLDGPPLAASPVNGNGHVLPDVPLEAGRAWLTGSTYGRGDADAAPRDEDQSANLERLRTLLPEAADRLAPAFASGTVRAWSGVRCASSDRRPLVGEVQPGLWVSTAMGSRGLTFAPLCAELLAARLHAEPLPLPARLAAALDLRRQPGLRPSRAVP